MSKSCKQSIGQPFKKLLLFTLLFLVHFSVQADACPLGKVWDEELQLCITPSAPIVTFSVTAPGVSSTTISRSTATTLIWKAVHIPNTCTPGGGWANGDIFTGSGDTGILTSSKTYTFSCSNSYGTSSLATVTINVCALATPVWNNTTQTCVAKDAARDCPAATDISQSDCTYDAPYLAKGDSISVPNTKNLFTGSATISCSDSVRTFSNVVCNCVGVWNAPVCTNGETSDLVASAASPTRNSPIDAIVAGVPNVLSSTITNIGAGDSLLPFSGFFQVSTDPNASPIPFQIDLSPVSVAMLPMGDSAVIQKSYTFASPGTYFIRACADKTSSLGGGVITESNEANNCGAWTDVEVYDATLMSASNCTIAAEESTCLATPLSVTNPIFAFYDLVNVTTGITTPNMFFAANSYTYNLGVEDTAASLTQGINVLHLRQNGSATNIATVWALGTCAINTTWDGTICKTDIIPDLVVSTSSPAATTPTHFTTLRALITNQGTGSTGAPFMSFFQVATSSDGAGTIIDLASTSTPTLGIGATTTVEQLYKFIPGNYSIRACADKTSSSGGEVITESNETNNCGPWRNLSSVCLEGGWNNIGITCANPQITSLTVTGQYYDPTGTLSFTCDETDNWEMYKDYNPSNPVVTQADLYTSGQVDITVSQSGNYTIICRNGDYPSPPSTIYYSALATPPATVSLSVMPGTIAKNGQAVLNWNTKFPTTSCTLSAKVVCTNNLCNDAQLAYEAAMNTRLTTESTDTNDPNTSRPIVTAVQTVAPGHMDVDWKGFGRKTFTEVPYTTDFTYQCSPTNKETKRLRVTKTQEG